MQTKTHLILTNAKSFFMNLYRNASNGRIEEEGSAHPTIPNIWALPFSPQIRILATLLLHSICPHILETRDVSRSKNFIASLGGRELESQGFRHKVI